MRRPTAASWLLAALLPFAHALRLPAIALSPQDAAASVCIFACGDVLSQKIEALSLPRRAPAVGLEPSVAVRRTVSTAAVRRTLSAAALGSIYGGALLPFVYQLAEGLFPGVGPLRVLAKVLVSCGLLSTFGNYFSLFWRRVAQPAPAEPLRERLARCAASVNAEMPSVLSHDLRVWPAYDCITFALIPPAVRPLTCALVSVCWNVYIAYVAAASTASAAAELQVVRSVAERRTPVAPAYSS